jgi:hypothetical protein
MTFIMLLFNVNAEKKMHFLLVGSAPSNHERNVKIASSNLHSAM